MKTAIQLRMAFLALICLLFLSCGTSYKGSASDRTGTNGATNGTGKVPKSNGVHNFRN